MHELLYTLRHEPAGPVLLTANVLGLVLVVLLLMTA